MKNKPSPVTLSPMEPIKIDTTPVITKVFLVNPTQVNNNLVSKIDRDQVGKITMHDNHIAFGKFIIPLTNVKVLEIEI